jgi:hypothetical protein
MKRRDFISTVGLGASAAVATGLTGCSAGSSDPPVQAGKENEGADSNGTKAGIQCFAAIGATGLKMSDISMGCGGLDNPFVAEKAIDMGINYFDTAPDYGNGASESALGKIFADPAKREQCIVTTKFCLKSGYPGHLPVGSPEADFITAVEESLKRLQTDYIDFIMIHAIGEKKDDFARLTDPAMLSAVAKLKEQGKVRHLGTSSHGPNQLGDHLIHAIESGHYDMLMPAMNFMDHPKLGDVLKKAKENNVGIVAMKTLAGARGEDLSQYQTDDTDLAGAAFKWIFTHPEVAGLVITMKTTAEVDHYTQSSGKRFSARDQDLLDQYSGAVWAQYCRTGCGDCLTHCPYDVAAPEILRLDMYFSAYGEHLKALKEYKRLPSAQRADACISCSGPCTDGCGFGVPVRERLLAANERLTLA